MRIVSWWRPKRGFGPRMRRVWPEFCSQFIQARFWLESARRESLILSSGHANKRRRRTWRTWILDNGTRGESLDKFKLAQESLILYLAAAWVNFVESFPSRILWEWLILDGFHAESDRFTRAFEKKSKPGNQKTLVAELLSMFADFNGK